MAILNFIDPFLLSPFGSAFLSSEWNGHMKHLNQKSDRIERTAANPISYYQSTVKPKLIKCTAFMM